MDKIILYHGSNIEVREPKIIKSKRLKDQIVFKTEKALSTLKYSEVKLV